MKQLSALLLTLVVITPNARLLAVKSGTSDSADNGTAKSTNKVKFNAAQFVPSATAPKIYLSSPSNIAAAADQPYQLASATLGTNANGAPVVVMTPLADKAPTINQDAGGAAAANPFNNDIGGVSGMALPSDGSVIAAYIGNDGEGAAAVNPVNGTFGNGCVFNVSTDGKTIFSSEILSNQAPLASGYIYGVEAAKSVKGAGKKPLTFAAVSEGAWNAAIGDTPANNGRGIAIVGAVDAPVAGDAQLTQRDPGAIDTAVGIGANKLSLPIRMDATPSTPNNWGDSLAINDPMNGMANALAVSKNVDLHWSDKLNCLYVGLDLKGSGVAGGNAADARGSLISVGVVDCKNNAAAFSSVIKKQAVAFDVIVPDQATNNVVAATRNTDDFANEMLAKASKVRTMATSTNKDYLIVNSAVAYDGGAATNVLAALPIAPASGCIASVDNTTFGEAVDFVAYPNAAANFPDATKPAVLIAPNLATNIHNLSDLYVDGDSVYLAMNYDVDIEPTARGLFRSTAIFNAAGSIIGWTPGERVGGDLGIVQAAGYDANTGNLYALTSETSNNGNPTAFAGGVDINTVKISNWGAADAVTANDPANNLGTELKAAYPSKDGGIHSIVSFNEATPGFANAGSAKDVYNGGMGNKGSTLSLMAAVGKDQISLIQAGVGATGQSDFLATADFSGTGTPPVTYDAENYPDLGKIAPLSCVELSRASSGVLHEGYVFVGGYNGLAVISHGVDGFGYDSRDTDGIPTLADLTGAVDAVTQLQPTFAAATDFTDIRKLVAVRSIVFVMTGTKLFGFSVENGLGVEAHGKFDTVGTNNLDESAVTLGLPAGTQLYDMIAIENDPGVSDDITLILATSEGVYHAQVDAGATDGNFANVGVAVVATETTLVQDTAGTAVQPALQLNYLSSDRSKPSPQGNLFVLYAELETPETGVVKRYAVNVTAAAADRIKLISNIAAIDNDIIPNVNTFTLSDIRGGFTLNGNTIFQPRSYDVSLGKAEVAGLVMNSALDASATPAGAVLNATVINELVKNSAAQFLATPAVDPATGFVMVPHQAGIISNQ